MQLSCIPVSFFQEIIDGSMSIAQWAALGAKVGLDAVDLSVIFFSERSAKEVAAAKAAVESAGMQVTMLNTYPDLTHPDAAERKRQLALEIENVRIADGLGAKMVRVVAGQAHPETGRAQGIGWAIDGIRALADATAGLGPRLVYENHGKPGAWQYTDFSQPTDIFLAIADGIKDTSVGINFDTANATSFAEDPVALLERVIDRVVSVHAADTAVKGALQPVLLGTGVAPFVPLFTLLHQAGFDDWMCIEEASFTGPEGLAKAVEFTRRMWQETA